MKRGSALLFAGCVVCAACGPARAQAAVDPPDETGRGNPAILEVNNGIALSYLLSRLYYAEPNNGYATTPSGYLDRETGNLNGGRIALSVMTRLENYYVHAEWSGAEGKIDYSGYYQGGPPYIPANLKSRATTQEAAVKIGKGFLPGEKWMLTPYLSFGRRYWVREIGVGTRGSFVESYNFIYYALGGMIQYSPWERWVLTGSAELGRTTDAWINVPPAGLNHTSLGSSLIKKFGAEVDYRAVRWLHLFAGFDYTHFRFGESALQYFPFGYVLEPFSRTEIYNYTVGVRLPLRLPASDPMAF